ncbi:MAG: hypothetical protein EP298_05305 [Gammaproteobacteria bacterium]|nr:MAG: hypothetical protein EP298_05305 [Gammaproteobacteria bacterium]UTW42460.1 hypothetical protein KFE69_13450 [bacterium SCSIO 12844]
MPRKLIRKHISRGQFGTVDKLQVINDSTLSDGLYAKKVIKPSKLEIVDVPSEAHRWNQYFISIGLHQLACASSENTNTMYTPWIEGSEPSREEVQQAVDDLFKQGYLIADPKPDNFKKLPNGKIIPIDFGEIFHTSSDAIPPRSIALIHNAVSTYGEYFPENIELTQSYLAFKNDKLKSYQPTNLDRGINFEWTGFDDTPTLCLPEDLPFSNIAEDTDSDNCFEEKQTKQSQTSSHDQVPLLFAPNHTTPATQQHEETTCCIVM